MKRIVCGLMALLLMLAGTACGRDPEVAFPAQVTTQTLLESGAFSEELEELEAEIAVMLFWLPGSAEQYEGSKVYCSTGATAETAAVISVRDEAQVPLVEDALKAWVDSQIEAEQDYRPVEVPKLENALIETRANSVLLVVAADTEKAEKAIKTIGN